METVQTLAERSDRVDQWDRWLFEATIDFAS